MRKNKGFSLIEMLIIVAMIAALVAIGYPYFRGVMEKNKENADIAAMHSAEALMETAYNTRLIIDKKSATEAKATGPLYYDPSGKLVWKRPAPYGQGTDGNQGVTWSCCGDYAYNPANDYRQGVVVCYYTPEGNNNPYPGIHVHWDCDGTIIAPDPVVKPTKPVFPERPTTEPTEGVTDDGGGSGGDSGDIENPETTYPTTPEGDWTVEEILTTGHPYPTSKPNATGNGYSTTDFPIVAGHRYIYKGKVYVAKVTIQEGQKANYTEGAYTPEAWAQYYFAIPNSDRILTSKKNVDEQGRLVVDNSKKNEYGQSELIAVDSGNLFINYKEDGTVEYYVRYASATAGVVPWNDPNNWIKLCSKAECADCAAVPLPKTGS